MAVRSCEVGPVVRSSRRQVDEARRALVVARLEEAGATLLALPLSGWSTQLRVASLDVVPEPMLGYGWSDAVSRPPVPSSARITRMDEALAWIALIPPDRIVLRKIVGLRALVSPKTERHLYPWRRIGRVLGCDHHAVQRWHSQGIDLIAARLPAEGLCEAA